MSELLHQLGIDWRLLLSQAANFLILLIVLRLFAYKPIIKMLKDRAMKIQEGVDKAKEADSRLQEANEMAKHKLKQAEVYAVSVLQETEAKAKKLEDDLLSKAKEKEAALLLNTEEIIKEKAEQAKREMHKEAAMLVKEALIATVNLDPKKIDEKLIEQAVSAVSKSK